jgi:hypothetical protein
MIQHAILSLVAKTMEQYVIFAWIHYYKITFLKIYGCLNTTMILIFQTNQVDCVGLFY